MNSFYMAVVILVFCLTAIGLVNTRQFHLQNNLGYTVWVAIKGDSGRVAPDNGGFVLYAGGRRSVNVADNWGGRFWGRTGCSFGDSGHGRCVTGDCDNKLHCNESKIQISASVAEIALRGYHGEDFYDVSFTGGFNIPIQMKPSSGRGHLVYSCGTAGCKKNLNLSCPKNLQVRKGNEIVACRDSCSVSKEDKDCCRGKFNTVEDCQSSESVQYFSSNCPNAYSHSLDDKTSTFTCKDTNYDIVFG